MIPRPAPRSSLNHDKTRRTTDRGAGSSEPKKRAEVGDTQARTHTRITRPYHTIHSHAVQTDRPTVHTHIHTCGCARSSHTYMYSPSSPTRTYELARLTYLVVLYYCAPHAHTCTHNIHVCMDIHIYATRARTCIFTAAASPPLSTHHFRCPMAPVRTFPISLAHCRAELASALNGHAESKNYSCSIPRPTCIENTCVHTSNVHTLEIALLVRPEATRLCRGAEGRPSQGKGGLFVYVFFTNKMQSAHQK